MALSDKVKTVLLRFARVAGASVVGALIAFLAGPEVADLLGAQNAVILAAILTPLLVAFDKWLRFGSDPGEV